MSVVRQAVGKGRTVIEDVFWVAVKGCLESLVLLPIAKNLLFHVGKTSGSTSEIDTWVYSHNAPSVVTAGTQWLRGTTLLERYSPTSFVIGSTEHVAVLPKRSPVIAGS